MLQTLVEVISKRQGLQRTWELNLIQCIVEAIAKVQRFKATWQLHTLQNLTDWASKGELLDEWKVYILQVLLKIQAQAEALEAFGQSVKALIELLPKGQVFETREGLRNSFNLGSETQNV